MEFCYVCYVIKSMNVRNVALFEQSKLDKEAAWLLGFIFSDSTIGEHQGRTVIRLYNKNKELLDNIVEYFGLPNKVTKQVNQTTTVYFIRFGNQDIVSSIQAYGFQKDKTNLCVPDLDDECRKAFTLGFMQGKGSFFREEAGNYGFKIIYRSESFIKEVAELISFYCGVKVARPHCCLIKNYYSCQIKYVNSDCDRVKEFLYSDYLLFNDLKAVDQNTE
ncbi:hypothetical protein C8N47_1176 [Mangrovibacterium marinum]|uniref:Homing endonuclease LAGLIDADG domain-containing protein n=2 Tax=Mangrovibacterium marinum TaxID=1639118 RepID=A0A2T5BYW0_9BACT|nr:hypothetical protein C8N47_1176 [Mangrovibacterium marinum]